MPKILVVDDELSIRESFKLILEGKYEVVTAASGEGGLKASTDHQVDLAFLDIRMPGLNGLETLKRLKDINPSLEVVMVTAVNDVRKASEAGFRIHFIGVDLEKARDAPQLIAAVQATGGNYYDVRNAQELQKAYVDIDRLERGTFFTKERIAHVPHFYPFAFAAFLLLAASIALKAIPYFIEIS